MSKRVNWTTENGTNYCGFLPHLPIYPFTFFYPHLPFYFLGVPGKQKGWMSRHGHVLKDGPDGIMVCPKSGFRYKEETPGVLKCLDLNEEEALPEKMAKGNKSYKELK